MHVGDTSTNGGQITDRKIALGLWYVKHHLQLRRAGIGALIALCVVTWVYVLWGVVVVFFLQGVTLDRDLAVLASPENPRAAAVRAQRAQELVIEEVRLLRIAEGRYDIAARVRNPNPRILATIAYALGVAGAVDEQEEAVILPGRERWLTRLNVTSNTDPRTATLAVVSTAWERISHREIIDVETFISDRSQIDVSDARFISARELAPTERAARSSADATQVSRAVFTLANVGGYGIRDLEVTVLLRTRTTITGVNRVVIPSLQADAVRQDAATWFHAIGAVDRVEVIPYVNVFDPESFLEL
ncbi:MAG: hypothetical protein ABIG71_00495 [Candidatus Uhrbacteria bacterium]